MVFFQVFFFFTTMLLVNLFIALLLDNFDLMASEDMSISDMDIELFKRKWSQDDVPDERSAKGHRRTMHDGMHLYEIRHFVMQSGLGTFSMMYQADPYFFNRVLFELGYTAQHLHESTPAFPGYRGRSGLGTKVIKVPFPDLLLALCHIRFSSSCLSLAEEVEKSRVLVERYQAHAAKMLQVAARAFCTRRRVDVLGRRSPPGQVWSINNEHGAEPKLQSYPPKEQPRCDACTLPIGRGLSDVKNHWCRCSRFDEEAEHAKKLQQADDKLLTKAERKAKLKDERSKQKQKERQKIEEQDAQTKAEFGISRKEAEALISRDDAAGAAEGEAHQIFGLEVEEHKQQWDAAVNAARLLSLSALINTDRLIPEHLVSQAFDQLQDVVDKRKFTNCLGIVRTYGDGVEDEGAEEDEKAKQLAFAQQLEREELDAQKIVKHMLDILDRGQDNIAAAFSLFDKSGGVDEDGAVVGNGIVTQAEFKAALRELNHQMTSIQVESAAQVVSADQDMVGGVIDYTQFLEQIEGGEKAVEQFADTVVAHGLNYLDEGYGVANTQAPKKRRRKLFGKGKKGKQSAQPSGDAMSATFHNPLGDELQQSVDSSQDGDGAAGIAMVRHENPLTFETEDAEQLPSADVPKGAKKKGRFKRPKPSSIGKLGSAGAQLLKAPKYRYCVLTEAATYDAKSGSETGLLPVGEEMTVTRRELFEGRARVKHEQGWVDVVSDGALQLELLDDSVYMFRSLAIGAFSEGPEPGSSLCATFSPGQDFAVTEIKIDLSSASGGNMRVKCKKGWASTIQNDSETNVETVMLALADPHDRLRWFLRQLGVKALTRQAKAIAAEEDKLLIQAADPATCLDAKDDLVELIVGRYFSATESLELSELPRGWAGTAEGALSVGDKIEIQGEGSATDGRSSPDPERTALNGRRGYVKREVNLGEYEVELDNLRITYIVERANIRLQEIDELKSRTLFGTDEKPGIRTDDLAHFQKLLAAPVGSAICPADAVAERGGPLLGPGSPRIELARGEKGQSLYDVALQLKSFRIASFLRHHLLFYAVEKDDLKGLVRLLEDGLASPQLDDGEAGANHGLDSIRRTVNDDGEEELMPLIQLAHQQWEAAGTPHTRFRAQSLGGLCWFEISERWYDMYSFHYDPKKHGASMFADLHVEMSSEMVEAQLAAGGGAATKATKEEVETALEWKEKRAFMSRTTKMKS